MNRRNKFHHLTNGINLSHNFWKELLHFLKISVYAFVVALTLFSKLDFIRAAKQVVGVLSFLFHHPSARVTMKLSHSDQSKVPRHASIYFMMAV